MTYYVSVRAKVSTGSIILQRYGRQVRILICRFIPQKQVGTLLIGTFQTDSSGINVDIKLGSDNSGDPVCFDDNSY